MESLSVEDLARLKAHALGERSPLLLDVREPWEFEIARISPPGVTTVHIPMHELPGRLAELSPDQTIICLCHHGMRSAQVTRFLMRSGFQSVYNLSGGIAAWSERIDPQVPHY
jgi:rhodanese-related sulfurtransferase